MNARNPNPALPTQTPPPQKPGNGRTRFWIKWGSIGGAVAGLAGGIIALEKILEYRPVTITELDVHSLADRTERTKLKTDMDVKIDYCLDEIRKLREDRNAKIDEQNRLLREALQEMRRARP